jgi:hypothetical protein
MAMQQKPKPVAKKAPVNSTPPSKPTPKSKPEMRIVNDTTSINRMIEPEPPIIERIPPMREYKEVIEKYYPISNKDQSSPGKTSGGFSYRLKKD